MAVQTFPNLGLKYDWDPDTENFALEMDENFRKLSAITQLAVIDRDLVTAPGGPTDGDRYIIAGIGGLWSGFAINDVVIWDANFPGDGGDPKWIAYTPEEGWLAVINDENVLSRFTSSAWNAGISI